MGRRENVRTATREGIVRSARDAVVAEGVGAVTIRRIATEIGYSVPVVYQHFADKQAVVDAVVADGYARLAGRLAESVADALPGEALLPLSRTYMTFARDDRRIFELMNGAAANPDPVTRHRAASEVVRITREAVLAWAAARSVDLGDAQDESDTLWGLIHGLTGIGMLSDIGFERATRLSELAITALTTGWSVGNRS